MIKELRYMSKHHPHQKAEPQKHSSEKKGKTKNVIIRVTKAVLRELQKLVHRLTTSREIRFLEAIRDQDIALLSSEFKYDVRFNHHYLNGLTPLTYAAMLGKDSSLRYIVHQGVDVNDALDDYTHATPLFLAVQHQHPSTVEYLLKHGADPFKSTYEKLTPKSPRQEILPYQYAKAHNLTQMIDIFDAYFEKHPHKDYVTHEPKSTRCTKKVLEVHYHVHYESPDKLHHHHHRHHKHHHHEHGDHQHDHNEHGHGKALLTSYEHHQHPENRQQKPHHEHRHHKHHHCKPGKAA